MLASMAVFYDFMPVRAIKISFRAKKDALLIVCGNIYFNR